MQTAGPRKSIRELIAELAHLEDRRRASTAEPSNGAGADVFDVELLELARREQQVIAELRRRRSDV